MGLQNISVTFMLLVVLSFALEETKNLTRIVGGSVTFPDAITGRAFLSHEGNIIASVKDGQSVTEAISYEKRLVWNKTAAQFSITNLTTKDSGRYIVQLKSKDPPINRNYKLNVYEPVTQPAVNVSSRSNGSCTLLCFVERGEEAALSWHRGETVLIKRSPVHNLSITIEKQRFSFPHSCTAANPVDVKTLFINVKSSCSEDKSLSQEDHTGKYPKRLFISVIVCIAFAIALAIFVVIMKWRTQRQSQVISKPDDDAVVYTTIDVTNRQNRQGGDSPPPTEERANLTCLYDELQVHRMKLPDSTDENV